jgi:hypothetical protein
MIIEEILPYPDGSKVREVKFYDTGNVTVLISPDHQEIWISVNDVCRMHITQMHNKAMEFVFAVEAQEGDDDDEDEIREYENN